MAIVDINVVKASGRVCIADPAQLNQGDTVRWNNQTGGDIIVFFPHDDVLGNATKHFFNTIADKASHHHTGGARKKNAAGPAEQYSYAIYCLATGRFAVGGSDPEIIIF